MSTIQCSSCLSDIEQTDYLNPSACQQPPVCNECALENNTLFPDLLNFNFCHGKVSQVFEENMEVDESEISSTLEDDTNLDLEIVLEGEPNGASEDSEREKCDECSEADATVRCDNCVIILCDPCFAVVHKYKSLRNHQKIPLSHFKNTTLFTKDCAKHKLPFEYFCENDSVLICTNCFIVGDHKQHTPVAIKQKNDESLKLLEEAIELGETSTFILEAKKETEREMEIRTTYRDKYKKIDEVFNSFISKLETRKKSLQAELKQEYENYAKDELIRRPLQLRKLRDILDDSRSLVQNTNVPVNIQTLINEVKTLADLSKTDNQIPEPTIRYKKEIDPTVNAFARIITSSQDQLKDDDQASAINSRSPREDDQNSLASSSTLSLISSSDLNVDAPSKSNEKELVSVTHVRNPSHFWILPRKNEKLLKKLTSNINKWSRKKQQLKHSPKPGDIYLGQYRLDGKYYRARVEEECSVSKGEKKYRVFFIDFGNTDEVKYSSLMPIPKEHSHIKPLVKKCCLYGVSEDANWSKEAIEKFAKLINEKQFEMEIHSQKNEVLFIDLKLPNLLTGEVLSLNQIFTSEPKKTTILKKSNITATDANVKKEAIVEVEKQAQLIKPKPFTLGEIVDASIVFYDSPKEFYVQLQSNEIAASALNSKIQNFYNCPHYQTELLKPVIGMACVAKGSMGSQWCRAEIIDLLSPKEAVVKFVDLGIFESVDIASLRKIKDEFLALPLLAYHCSMTDWVVPNNDLPTVNKFCELTQNQIVYLVPHDINKENGSYGVSVLVGQDKTNVGSVLKKIGYSIKNVFSVKNPEKIEEEPASKEKESDVDAKYIHVVITSVQDPSNFYVRYASKEKEEAFKQLLEQLYSYFTKSQYEELEVEVGQIYATVSQRDEMWHRVKVSSWTDENYLEVLLLDTGTQEVTSLKNLRALPGRFQDLEFFAIQCHLKDVSPPKGQDTWSKKACDMLNQYKKSDHVLYLVHSNDPENGSLPVALYDPEIVKKLNILEDIKTYSSLRDNLIDLNLADPKMNFSGTEADSESYFRLKYQEAVIPEGINFDICPTYLDYSGDIYVQLTLNADNLEKISQELVMKSPSYELGYEGIEYFPNQACVAKFDLDKRWYRAQILKCHMDGIEVIFVDYGSNLLISNPDTHLYPDFVGMDIPKQCFKCSIWNIMPKFGKWSVATLDYIQRLIVERPCSIQIVETPTDGAPVKVNMYLPNGDSVADELTKTKKTDGKEKDSTLALEEAFPSIKLNEYEGLNVVFSHAAKNCCVYIQRMMVTDPTTKLHHDINHHFNKFSQMIDKISNNDFPPLNELEQYKMCCARSPMDETWYRAIIARMEVATVVVYFVDYGNVEEVPIDSLRVLPEEFYEVPGQAILVKLYDMENVADDEVVGLDMLSNLAENGVLRAVIKALGPTPEVELYDGEGNLAYQGLLDRKLIKRISDMDEVSIPEEEEDI